jgi:hypothetical protein
VIVALHRSGPKHTRAAVAIAIVALLTIACGNGLLFVKDERLRIVAPENMAAVSTPVQLRWTTQARPPNAPNYAVFVDALPVHPGQNLRSLAGAKCASVPTCVDVAWLNRHFVFLTAQPQLDLQALPILAAAKGERDIHKATIVLVDQGWRRLGESAWSVTFDVRHPPGP